MLSVHYAAPAFLFRSMTSAVGSGTNAAPTATGSGLPASSCLKRMSYSIKIRPMRILTYTHSSQKHAVINKGCKGMKNVTPTSLAAKKRPGHTCFP